MAESIVPLRKKIKDSLTRQGMRNIRDLHRKGFAEREKKERVLPFERVHKQVLTVTKNMHLILNSGTGTHVTVAISTAPDGGFHRESMSSQAKPAHIPHNTVMACLGRSRCRKRGGFREAPPFRTRVRESA